MQGKKFRLVRKKLRRNVFLNASAIFLRFCPWTWTRLVFDWMRRKFLRRFTENAFRGLNAKLDMTAIEVDHFNDDVVADPIDRLLR